MAGKKKKGKKRSRRVTDIGKQLTEEPGSGIEPGQALDEAESIEEPAKVTKAVKVRDAEKKGEKTTKKPPVKRPGVGAKLKRFFKDVIAEAKKIVWPDAEQQKNSTTVVVITIIALAAFMGFFSKILYNISDYVFLPNVAEESTGPDKDLEPGFEEGPEGEVEGVEGNTGDGAPGGAENLPKTDPD
jgi:preprotein translocase subunit SecE